MLRLLRYNIRSVIARRVVSLAVAFGIAVAAFIACTTAMLNESVSRLFAPHGRPSSVVILANGAATEVESAIDLEQQRAVVGLPYVKTEGNMPVASSELVLVLTLPPKGSTKAYNVVLRGLTAEGIRYRSGMHVTEGRAPTPGAYEAMIGKSIRGRFEHLELGERTEFGEGKSVTVVGVFEDGGSANEAEVVVDLQAMQAIFGRTGLVSTIRLDLNSPSDFDAFQKEVGDRKGSMVHAVRAAEYENRNGAQISGLVTFLGGIIGLLLSLGAALGALVAMSSSVASRQKEIGTLRALGFPARDILVGIIIEAVLIGLIGGVLGILGSLPLTRASVSVVGPNWAEIRITFVAASGMITGGMVVALVVALIGGFFPAIRALRISPIDALRN